MRFSCTTSSNENSGFIDKFSFTCKYLLGIGGLCFNATIFVLEIGGGFSSLNNGKTLFLPFDFLKNQIPPKTRNINRNRPSTIHIKESLSCIISLFDRNNVAYAVVLYNIVLLSNGAMVVVVFVIVVSCTSGNDVVGDGNMGGIKLLKSAAFVKLLRLVGDEKLEMATNELDIQKDNILFVQKMVQFAGKVLDSHMKI